MAFQSVPKGTRGHVPQTDDGVLTASGEGLPVGTERQDEDAAIRLTLQGLPEGPRGHIP